MIAVDKLIGIGLRACHYDEILNSKPDIGWLEVHSENYLYPGCLSYKKLMHIREHYPIALHGIALSLGSDQKLDLTHVKRLKSLIDDIDPLIVSEHLSWSRINGTYLPDLLPVVYNSKSANILIDNIKTAQDYLKRQLLIENPSSYFEYCHSDIDEAEFLVYVAEQSGAKILLDLNNIFVSAYNHDWNCYEYMNKIPLNLVAEFHLAGHALKKIASLPSDKFIRIDTHNTHVCDEVWKLYEFALKRFGPQPTLLEWDQDIPALAVLLDEANSAKQYLMSIINDIFQQPLSMLTA